MMPWWETKTNPKPLVPTRRVRCPVCKAIFGLVPKGKTTSFHCTECRATYTFTSFDAKPSVHLDISDTQFCHCAACRAKRGETEEFTTVNPPQPEGFDA